LYKAAVSDREPKENEMTKISAHISDIKAGDTVEHNGGLRTVCQRDIKRDPFMGTSLFGDTYRCGTRPVTVVQFN
jgi:hypothetical protein